MIIFSSKCAPGFQITLRCARFGGSGRFWKHGADSKCNLQAANHQRTVWNIWLLLSGCVSATLVMWSADDCRVRLIFQQSLEESKIHCSITDLLDWSRRFIMTNWTSIAVLTSRHYYYYFYFFILPIHVCNFLNTMKWNEMKWNEMKWNEMKWNLLVHIPQITKDFMAYYKKKITCLWRGLLKSVACKL